MRKTLAILTLIVLAGVIGAFLISRNPAVPVTHVRFPFSSFKQTTRGPVAVFAISNHPGYLSLHDASIEKLTPQGWANRLQNVTVTSASGLMVNVPVGTNEFPLRVVFDVQEGSSGIIMEMREWFEEHLFGSHGRERLGPHLYVTSEVLQATAPR